MNDVTSFVCYAGVGEAIPQTSIGVDFPPRSGEEKVLITRVIDGDTVEFCWLIPCRGRIRGINAPEMTGEGRADGLAARRFLEGLLPADGVAKATIHGTDKYGRTLIDLETTCGEMVSEIMLVHGHAVPYSGGRRT